VWLALITAVSTIIVAFFAAYPKKPTATPKIDLSKDPYFNAVLSSVNDKNADQDERIKEVDRALTDHLISTGSGNGS